MPTAADEIVETVRGYWNVNRRPVLLSVLGGRLSSAARDEIATEGTTLTSYLKTELKDRVRFLVLRPHGGGVAPIDGTEAFSDEELEALVPPPSGRNLPFAKPRPPRFHPDLWGAFFEPHPEPHVYVEMTDDGGVRIHRCDEQSPEPGWVEILPSDLPTIEKGARPYVPEVMAAIRTWAMKNEIPLNRLQSERETPPMRQRPQPAQLQSRSAIEEVFAYLTPDELRRISIPADILLNVLRRM